MIDDALWDAVKAIYRRTVREEPPAELAGELRRVEIFLECLEASKQASAEANAPLRELLDTLLRLRDADREEHRAGLARLEEVLRTAPRTAGGRIALPDEGCLRAYLEEVLRETDRIDIQGIGSQSGAVRDAVYFAIDELYTPLKTFVRWGDEEGALRAGEPFGRSDATELTDLLSRDGHLLLVGDPGGGKTTFLRFVASVLARDVLGEQTKAGPPTRDRHLGLPLDAPAPLPILVRVATLARVLEADDHGAAATPYRRLVDLLAERYEPEIAALLAGRLDAGGCLLLFDGLDEVSNPALRQRVAGVIDAAIRRWGARNRVVVASRPFGYEAVADLPGVRLARIEDFGEPEIRDFLRRWVRGLDGDGAMSGRGALYLPTLERAIVDDPNIRRLARNPVMLTCLCVVHFNEGGRLPQGKVNVLAAVLRWLLASRDLKRRERGWTTRFAEESFKELAFAMTFAEGEKRPVIDLDEAAAALAPVFDDERGVTDERQVRRDGRRFLREEALDSGVVVQPALGELRFWHLTFQEHLAARALVDRSDDEVWAAIGAKVFDRQWAEVVDHLAGCLVPTGRRRVPRLIERILDQAGEGDLSTAACVTAVLERVLRVVAVYDVRNPYDDRWAAVRARALSIFDAKGAGNVPVALRIAAAEALGRAVDPRLGAVPETIAVPGMDGVALGRYPVTVSQYAHFVAEGGYEDGRWWGDGWTWRMRFRWEAPDDWAAQDEWPNRPVVGVSWYEAAAYCEWRSAQAGQAFRLPTEREWAAAATPPAGDYPWGAAAPDPERANFSESEIGHATPVGVYPTGAGPAGHLDLAGNVWEWCVEEVEDKEMAEWWRERLELDAPPALRALRGGSWFSRAGGLRSSVRSRDAAVSRDPLVGFRVASSPPSTGTS